MYMYMYISVYICIFICIYLPPRAGAGLLHGFLRFVPPGPIAE